MFAASVRALRSLSLPLGILMVLAPLLSFQEPGQPGDGWDCRLSDGCDEELNLCHEPELKWCARCSASVQHEDCVQTGHPEHNCTQEEPDEDACGKWERASCIDGETCGNFVPQPGDCAQRICY